MSKNKSDQLPQEQQRDYFAQKYQGIRDLPGLGEATAKSLEALGYTTVKSIATASLREIMAIEGIGEPTAKKFIEEAGKTLTLKFMFADDFAEMMGKRENLSFGVPLMDELVDGGLPTNSISELFGEFGSGKSQICHQLAVIAQLPKEKGGLGCRVLYIDVESVFQPEKIIAIGKRFGVENPLKGIILAEAHTSDHQCELLENAEGVIDQYGVRVVIIDGVMSHFRSEYIGRENLGTRQQKLNKHLHRLVRILRQYNAVGVVTNQVSSTPDSFAGYRPKAIGGHILGHKAHTIIFLRKVGKAGKRLAEINASPFFAAGTQAPYEIMSDGIHGKELDPDEGLDPLPPMEPEPEEFNIELDEAEIDLDE